MGSGFSLLMMSNYVVSLPAAGVSPGNYVIGDGGILLRVKEDDDDDGDGERPKSAQLLACGHCMATFTAKEALARHAVKCRAAKKKKTRKGSEKSVRVVCTSSDDGGAGERQQATTTICPRKGCVYQFTPSELETHLSCHVGGGNTFACPKCSSCPAPKAEATPGAEFAKWRPLASHLWKSHSVSVGLTSCPVCHEFKTGVPSALREHLLVHSDERKFKCSECGRSFKQMSQLTNHVVGSHLRKAKGESGSLPAWCSKKKCDLCQKLFSDSKCLKKHVQAVHGKLKPYICHVCNHQSARKAMMEMHMRQHTGEKPYGCDECDYRTADHNSLRRHKMRHSGARPYRCPFCEYSSIQASTFKNHVVSRHSNDAAAPESADGTRSVYACQDCNFKTVNRETYFGHLGNNHCRQQRDGAEEKDEARCKSDATTNSAKQRLSSSSSLEKKLDESSSPLNMTNFEKKSTKVSAKSVHRRPRKGVSDTTFEGKIGNLKSTILASKRESVQAEVQKDAITSALSSVKGTRKVFEEEDSLHGPATTDLGGTTTPA